LRELDIHRECDPQSLHNPLHPKKIGKNQKDPLDFQTSMEAWNGFENILGRMMRERFTFFALAHI
jgi:hypothetical protein